MSCANRGNLPSIIWLIQITGMILSWWSQTSSRLRSWSFLIDFPKWETGKLLCKVQQVTNLLHFFVCPKRESKIHTQCLIHKRRRL